MAGVGPLCPSTTVGQAGSYRGQTGRGSSRLLTDKDDPNRSSPRSGILLETEITRAQSINSLSRRIVNGEDNHVVVAQIAQ